MGTTKEDTRAVSHVQQSLSRSNRRSRPLQRPQASGELPLLASDPLEVLPEVQLLPRGVFLLAQRVSGTEETPVVPQCLGPPPSNEIIIRFVNENIWRMDTIQT